jgi:DnaJ-class molecular chaperone
MTSAKTITDAFMRSAEEIKSLRDQVAEQRAQITADNNEILTMRQQRDALEQALEIATDDMDAVECPDCGGHGRREVYRDVTHQLGTDKLPFWEECETCSGTGYCGPDAEKRAAIAKVKPS